MNPSGGHPLIAVTSLLLRGLYRLFGGFTVRGLEHLPQRGAAIVASNHLSWADPPALRIAIRRRCWFMANDFLFRIPVVGRLLPLYGAFPVIRGRLDREALRRAQHHLQEGDLVVIFPEGGTSLTGRLVPFEGGVALLALRNRCPVVPVAISGTDRVLPMKPPYYPRWARGGVTVTFGPPLHPDDVPAELPLKERGELLTARIYSAILSMLPAEYHPLPEEMPDGARGPAVSASLRGGNCCSD